MTNEHATIQFGFFETRLDGIDKKLSVLDTLDQKVAKLEAWSGGVQRDVDAIAKRQATDSKVLEDVASTQAEAAKFVDEMAGTVNDTHQRLVEVKDYSKDALDTIDKKLAVLDTIDQKLVKLEGKMTWSGGVEQVGVISGFCMKPKTRIKPGFRGKSRIRNRKSIFLEENG